MWSRLAQPDQHGWQVGDAARRLLELEQAKDDPDPKALACYGLLVRRRSQSPDQMLLRFVDGRPVSAITTEFLTWCCERLASQGATAFVLIWDNASWHKSQAMRTWIRSHYQAVKQAGQGLRILPCLLPSKSPGLNPTRPKWVHGKRAISEPNRLLGAAERASRVCAS